MAGRITRLLSYTALSTPASVRASSVRGYAHYGDRTFDLRATRVEGYAHFGDKTFDLRSTFVGALGFFSDKTFDVRVTYVTGMGLQSIKSIPRPDGNDALVPEINPYRPTVPEEFAELNPVLYSFMREQTEIQREQHNLTQAGDTTYPWEVLTQVQMPDEKLFTLGSLGRFYHEDWGLILARYVQFHNMSPDPNISAPLGFLKDSGGVEWVVTDRIELSHPDMVCGVMGAFQAPVERGFGWAIVSGSCLDFITQKLRTSVDWPTPMAWAGTGVISAEAEGRVIGRIRAKITETQFIRAGLFQVGLESYSVSQLASLVNAGLADTAAGLEELKDKVAALEGADFGKSIAEIEDELRVLTGRIAEEESKRLRGDANLGARIDGLNAVSQGNLDSAIATLRADLEGRIAGNELVANEALSKATLALARIDNIDLGPQLQSIIDAIVELNAQVDRVKSGLLRGDVADLPDPLTIPDSVPVNMLVIYHAEDTNDVYYFNWQTLDWDSVVTTGIAGPASSADNAVARWDGTSGTQAQDSLVFVNDAGNLGVGTNNPLRLVHYQFNNNGTIQAYENLKAVSGSQTNISFRGATTGAGATTFVELGGFEFELNQANHATAAGQMRIFTINAGAVNYLGLKGDGLPYYNNELILTEAPIDGDYYARKDGDWESFTPGGGGGGSGNTFCDFLGTDTSVSTSLFATKGNILTKPVGIITIHALVVAFAAISGGLYCASVFIVNTSTKVIRLVLATSTPQSFSSLTQADRYLKFTSDVDLDPSTLAANEAFAVGITRTNSTTTYALPVVGQGVFSNIIYSGVSSDLASGTRLASILPTAGQTCDVTTGTAGFHIGLVGFETFA